MNVDDAMETAAAYLAYKQEEDPIFTSEEVAITLAAEVERLRAERESVIRLGPHPVEQVEMSLDVFIKTRFVPVWEYNELADKIERLRTEVEMGHSFHRIAIKERDFERLLVEALREELAAAKASSAVPVKIDWFYSSNLCEVIVNCNDEYEASEFGNWLDRRTKENLF